MSVPVSHCPAVGPLSGSLKMAKQVPDLSPNLCGPGDPDGRRGCVWVRWGVGRTPSSQPGIPILLFQRSGATKHALPPKQDSSSQNEDRDRAVQRSASSEVAACLIF